MTARLPRLKWHMLKRRVTDPPFLRDNLEAGLRAAAALEVDLVSTSDGHFVCLHDVTLDRETTGSGLAGASTRDELHRLRQRGADGNALDDPPLFLDEVVAAIARHPHRDRQVQLDFKEPGARFDDAMLRRLRVALGDLASAFIFGSTDAEVFARVQSSAPEIAVGFDPLELHEERMPKSAQEFEALAETTTRLGPHARIYYLNADLVLAGLAAGVNLVERVCRASAEVDAWTIDPTRPRIREDLRRLVEAGCHQITTNDPDGLLPILQEIA